MLPSRSRSVLPVVVLPLLMAGACVEDAADTGSSQHEISGSYITTYSDYAFPAGAFGSQEIQLTIDVDPGLGAHRFFAHQFSLGQTGGYIGLQTDGRRADGSIGKLAIFSIWDAAGGTADAPGSWCQTFGGEGEGWSCRIPYDWQAGRSYQLRVGGVPGAWHGSIADLGTGDVVTLGTIATAPTERLTGGTSTFTEYYGGDFAQCSDLRLSRVTWNNPTANGGALASALRSTSIGDGACPALRTSTGAGPTTHAVGSARVLYVGDSLAAETSSTVSWWIGVGGKASVAASVFPGMALCDYLEGKPAAMPVEARLAATIAADKPDLVILQFWGNALTPCMDGLDSGTPEYYTRYFWDALNAVNQIEAAARSAGIARPKLLWVLQGPDAGNRERTRQLNGIYQYVAALRGDRTTDAGFTVSLAADPSATLPDPRYQHAAWLPCTAFEHQVGYCTAPADDITQIHKATDSVHFCLGDLSTWDKFFTCANTVRSPGILRYGMRIAHDASRWLGL